MIYDENALVLAPLSGFTDLPYRRAARRCGCVYAFTEMVDAASLAYASGKGGALLLRGEEEEFLGTQLVGSSPELLTKAAQVLNGYDFSLLDFNLGCPVPKVVKKFAGAALGQRREEAWRCFDAIAKVSKFTLTAKLRILSETDPQPTVELCRGLVESGAKVLTLHGRTREHFYTGTVFYDIISAVRESFPQVEVIANGGVKNLSAYRQAVAESGCSRVMLAQGAMGNPWLFTELAQEQRYPLGAAEWQDMVYWHIAEMVELYGEERALRLARKIVHDYMKGRGLPSIFRARAGVICRLEELKNLLAEAVNVMGQNDLARK